MNPIQSIIKKWLFTLWIFVSVGVAFGEDLWREYYRDAYGQTGEALKASLHHIINNHRVLPYTSPKTDVWDALKVLDEDSDNPENVILVYTRFSLSKTNSEESGMGRNKWNREHLWAKSKGFPFETRSGVRYPAYTDLHHLRPALHSVNSSRNDLDFDYGGRFHSVATLCRYDHDSWEPPDVVKGDIARALFYMAVRYEGDVLGEPDLEIVDGIPTRSQTNRGEIGRLSALLEWHQADPPDESEKRRNNLIYSNFQGNRNPFIDHPEWVSLVFGGEPWVYPSVLPKEEWQYREVWITSPNFPDHYPANFEKIYRLRIRGAKAIRLRFREFSIEAKYDNLSVLGLYDSTITHYTGNLGEFTTSPVEGEVFSIYFQTDDHISDMGWAIDRVEWIE